MQNKEGLSSNDNINNKSKNEINTIDLDEKKIENKNSNFNNDIEKNRNDINLSEKKEGIIENDKNIKKKRKKEFEEKTKKRNVKK